jgi:hypothetical protein
MRMNAYILLAGVWTVGLWACGASAQLVEVEQGWEDAGPAAASLRRQRADLRLPMDFDKVYRVDPNVRLFGGASAGADPGVYARISGGLVAVFPRGQYRVWGRGVRRAETPTNTVYLIGDPKKLLAPTLQSRVSSASLVQPITTRLDATRPAEPVVRLGRVTPDVRSMLWENDTERAMRVRQHLEEAYRLSRR